MNTSTRTPAASGFSLRAGSPSDLSTLTEIDNDAGQLFEQSGLDLDLPEDHEFFASERRRWSESLAAGRTLIAVDTFDRPVGFIALGARDGMPHIEQLSVRLDSMRRGVGSALLAAGAHRAVASGSRRLWLTTYDHLPFNRPYYERHGFKLVPLDVCGPEIRATAEFERRWLPLPHERVVMCQFLGASA